MTKWLSGVDMLYRLFAPVLRGRRRYLIFLEGLKKEGEGMAAVENKKRQKIAWGPRGSGELWDVTVAEVVTGATKKRQQGTIKLAIKTGLRVNGRSVLPAGYPHCHTGLFFKTTDIISHY